MHNPSLLTLAVTFVFAASSSTFADACTERFKTLMVDGNNNRPSRIVATQAIEGGSTSVTEFSMRGPDHWLSKVVDPAGQPWTLAYDKVMYTSADNGKSWKKVRSMEGDPSAEAMRNDRLENAATTENARCGTEVVDGKEYETVEADFKSLQNFKADNHHKYWVDPKTGWIARAEYRLKGNGFSSTTSQVIEPAENLDLPTP